VNPVSPVLGCDGGNTGSMAVWTRLLTKCGNSILVKKRRLFTKNPVLS